MSAAPTSEELLALFERGTLASAMASRFNLRNEDEIEAVNVRCAELHNEGHLDLLLLIEKGALQALDEHRFFAAVHYICRILPKLEEPPARMMTCVEALVARGGQDLAANVPNAAFRTWCAKVPSRAQEVIAAARAGDGLAMRHLTFALEAINDTTQAREIALSYDDARCLSAITALGRIPDVDPASCAKTFCALSDLTDRGQDDNTKAHLLLALMAILARSNVERTVDPVGLVKRLVHNAGDFTLHQCAHVLWACHKALQEDIVVSILDALIRLNPANRGTVNELDHGLQSLMGVGYSNAAISYVGQLLSRRDNCLELSDFSGFTQTLVTGPTGRLSHVIVRWLQSGEPRLCGGLANALTSSRDLKGVPLELRSQDLAISPIAQLFLCRKAIGWFFFKPITAASVLVSVLRVCNDATASEIQILLVQTLLQNYVGVKEYLETLDLDDAAKHRVDQALDQNEAYLRALRTIPVIKEMQPTEHNRRIERVRMSDLMRDAHKRAESQSVLLSLVKRSVLLYGRRSISFIKDGSNESRPMEMDLRPYGVSFEMPRMEIADPVGLDHRLRVFRAERMLA